MRTTLSALTLALALFSTPANATDPYARVCEGALPEASRQISWELIGRGLRPVWQKFGIPKAVEANSAEDFYDAMMAAHFKYDSPALKTIAETVSDAMLHFATATARGRQETLVPETEFICTVDLQFNLDYVEIATWALNPDLTPEEVENHKDEIAEKLTSVRHELVFTVRLDKVAKQAIVDLRDLLLDGESIGAKAH